MTRLEQLVAQERSCEMWIPRNLKLVMHSTATPLMWIGDRILPERALSFFCCVQQEVAVVAPRSQVIHLLSIGQLIVLDEANHGGVVSKLDDAVGAMFRSAVVG